MRIVALSDQHGHLPEIPPCDLLLIGGDICPDRIGSMPAREYPRRQAEWFDGVFRSWLDGTPAAHKVAIWGNHDWCGLTYQTRTDRLGVGSAADLQILLDTGVSIPARGHADRSATGLKIWGTPWANLSLDWAFMKPPEELARVYAAIPDNVDILLSHQPPYGYGDQVYDAARERFDHLGSRELLSAIDRIRPRLVICGHIHSGFGHYVRHGTEIYNVSVVNNEYRHVNAPTIIDLP